MNLCRSCNDPVEPGCVMCRRHLDMNRTRNWDREPAPRLPVPPPVPIDPSAFLGRLVQGLSNSVNMAEGQREDFAQELWMKLLAAEVLVKCALLPEEKRKTFLQVAAWRHALNCKRSLRRKVEPELPFDPQDARLDEPAHADEEHLAHCRHLLRKMEDKFEEYVEAVYDGTSRTFHVLRSGQAKTAPWPLNDRLFKLLRAGF